MACRHRWILLWDLKDGLIEGRIDQEIVRQTPQMRSASSAYLTVSEIFPLEARALAIAIFYALGTAIGGATGPSLFGYLIGTGSIIAVAVGYAVAAVFMRATATRYKHRQDVAEQGDFLLQRPILAEFIPVGVERVRLRQPVAPRLYSITGQSKLRGFVKVAGSVAVTQREARGPRALRE
jgi:MFS family permease